VMLAQSGKNGLKVTADNTTVTLEGFEGKDYPPVPKQKGKAVIVSDLDKALDDVLYAVAKEANRPVLQGVCFTPRNGRVELAAADGFRLSITSAKVRGTWPEGVIIGGAALHIVKRLFRGNVAVTIQGKDEKDKTVIFQQGTLMLFTRPTTGTFPDYSKLIPKGGRIVKFGTKVVQEALRKVKSVQPITKLVRLRSKGKDKMVVSGEEPGVGNVSVTVPVKGRVKNAIDINYLSDLLSRMDEETVMRVPASNNAPIMVRRNGTIHVVMQMQAQWEDKKPVENQG